MMDEETKQAHFIIGMALFVCILLVLGHYFAAPPVQIITPAESVGSSAEVSVLSSPASAALPPEEANGEEAAGKININTATSEQLQTLPGIGPALAERIIAYRTAYGSFTSVEQLTAVQGIGEKKLAAILEYITV